ncbi:hypothetical protein MP228_009668 [Amoeboaphelidium protococcarum]|nr:hypothetical protein MP228_009668 [Amoeboaphelidium protococcarum]
MYQCKAILVKFLRVVSLGVEVEITSSQTEADTADFLNFKPDKGKGRALVQEDGDSSCLYGLMDSVKKIAKFEFGEDVHRKNWAISGSQNQENHCIKWTSRRIFQMVILLLKMVFRMILQVSLMVPVILLIVLTTCRVMYKKKLCGTQCKPGIFKF